MARQFVTLDWLKENTTLDDPMPGQRVTLANVQDYEISEHLDPETGAILLYPVGASGRPSKNPRAVKLQNTMQSIRVVARTSDKVS